MRNPALGSAALAALALCAVPAASQDRDTARVYLIDTVTVTATRHPALRGGIPQKVEVISELAMRRSPATELADVLKQQAAVDVIQYPGLLSGVGIRGFRPDFSWVNQRTLILVDGRPAGITNLSTIDPGSIERIEVLKGPASSLYGSSAMGGAVNLISRRSTGDPGGRVSAAYGSWRTVEVSARAGGSLSSRLDADLGLGYVSRGADYRIGDGNLLRGIVGSDRALRVFPDSVHAVPEVGDGLRNPNSRYSYATGSGRVGVRLTQSLRVDARGAFFDADDVEAPADLYSQFDTGLRKDLDRRTAEVGISGEFGRHAPLARWYAADEGTEFFDTSAEDPFVSSRNQTGTWGVQLQDAARLGEHLLTGGADYMHQETRWRTFSAPGVATGPFSPDAALSSAALFAEGRASLLGGRLIGTLGGRLDRLSLDLRRTPLREDVSPGRETFTVFSPSAGVQYAFAEGARVHATAGRAFVTPDVLFKAGLGLTRDAGGVASITLGNPELDPESSVTWDVGIGVVRPRWGMDADVTYFHTDVKDRIAQVAAVFPALGRPRISDGTEVGVVGTWVNATTAEMEGIEWRVGMDFGALLRRRYSMRLFANATHFLSREERVPLVSVDAVRFAGRTDFRPEEVSGALIVGRVVARDVRNVASATVGYGAEYDDLRRLSIRVAGRHVGERLDLDFSDFTNITDIRYPAFMTLDLTVTVRLMRGYTLALLAGNVTDENYYEKRGYNLPGRTLRLRLSADF